MNSSEVAELPAIYIWNGQGFQDTTEFVTLSGMPGHWNRTPLNSRASVFDCVKGILDVHSNKHLSFNQLKPHWLTEIPVE